MADSDEAEALALLRSVILAKGEEGDGIVEGAERWPYRPTQDMLQPAAE